MNAPHSTLHFTLPDVFHSVLRQAAVTQNYQDGELLFQKGEAVRGAYLIESGRVALRLADMPDVQPRVVGPGTLLGLPSTIGCRPYSLTAQAIEVVETSFISRAEFMMLLQQHPALCLALVHGLAWEITEAREQMLTILEQKRDQALARSA